MFNGIHVTPGVDRHVSSSDKSYPPPITLTCCIYKGILVCRIGSPEGSIVFHNRFLGGISP